MKSALFLVFLLAAWGNQFCQCSWFPNHISFTTRNNHIYRQPVSVRGGEQDIEDSERYSRQVYTLGVRAQSLIRSSVMYLDGPTSSGLLYETAKNLALSGVRQIVILQSDNELDKLYHNAPLDDLGQAYQRSIRAELDELGYSVEDLSDAELLVEYIRRLNPGVLVSMADRTELGHAIIEENINRHVLISVDRSSSSNLLLNQIARENDWAFVVVETAGIFGRVFCDFGPSFQVDDADGETPLVTPLDKIELEDTNADLVVHCVLGEKHDVSKGDHIEFQLRNGSIHHQRCIVTNVKNPFRFTVQLLEQSTDGDRDSSNFLTLINEQAASFRRVKVPQLIEFQSFNNALKAVGTDPLLFAACDLEKSFDTTRKLTSMACFQTLPEFIRRKNRQPELHDLDEFWDLTVNSCNLQENIDLEKGQMYCQSFLRGCAAKFSPLLAIFGAIAAQEALKAATSLYYPVKQFLLYDCDEVLPKCDVKTEYQEKDSCSTSGLRYILGDDIVDELQSKQVFIVGAGAIGCELLKNLASLGVGTKGKGKIYLTDMDTIEKSNLSRQLLFRDSDIGNFKSAAAQRAALRFNPDIKVEPHTSRVGVEQHTPFDKKFWSNSVDVVLNALDNVEARIFMDEQCVRYHKALVDAGTMGSKGNVQVVVPNQSESYASSVDPPEPSIAVCTLKNFPYAISHTIQWARDLFDGLFQRRCDRFNELIGEIQTTSINDVLFKLLNDCSESSPRDTAQEIQEDFIALSYAEDNYLSLLVLEWAASLAYDMFVVAPQKLITEHPLESHDEDGEPFWSGTRRPPRELIYSTSKEINDDQESINANLIDFVRGAARLRLETITGQPLSSTESLFTPNDAISALRRIYERRQNEVEDPKTLQQPEEDMLKSCDNAPSLCSDKKFQSIEFEKDDETNGHVAFVNAASNLRAICYGIPPVDQMETRRVAGNIVPAMITTTAFVSALSCIEFVKLSQSLSLQAYRNAFVNLALPFFAFTVPLPAEPVTIYKGRSFTIWDRIRIKESKKAAKNGGITMRSMLRKLNKMIFDSDSEETIISSVSLGPYLLYANFLHEGDDEILDKSLWEVIDNALDDSHSFETEFSREGKDKGTITSFSVEDGTVEVTVTVQDEDGEEFELPMIQIIRYDGD